MIYFDYTYIYIYIVCFSDLFCYTISLCFSLKVDSGLNLSMVLLEGPLKIPAGIPRETYRQDPASQGPDSQELSGKTGKSGEKTTKTLQG